MNLFGVISLSGTALKAERMGAEILASNMANAETTRTATGGPYQRKHVVFAATSETTSAFHQVFERERGRLPGSSASAAGVEVTAVVDDPGAPLRRYDPGHPDADQNGYVSFPDIDPMTEMVDMMGAARSYQLNASAIQASKSMLQTSIDLLK